MSQCENFHAEICHRFSPVKGGDLCLRDGHSEACHRPLPIPDGNHGWCVFLRDDKTRATCVKKFNQSRTFPPEPSIPKPEEAFALAQQNLAQNLRPVAADGFTSTDRCGCGVVGCRIHHWFGPAKPLTLTGDFPDRVLEAFKNAFDGILNAPARSSTTESETVTFIDPKRAYEKLLNSFQPMNPRVYAGIIRIETEDDSLKGFVLSKIHVKNLNALTKVLDKQPSDNLGSTAACFIDPNGIGGMRNVLVIENAMLMDRMDNRDVICMLEYSKGASFGRGSAFESLFETVRFRILTD